MAGGVAPWPGITELQAKTVGAFRQFSALGPTQPDEVLVDTSAGGSSTQQGDGVKLSTDATASEHASAVIRSFDSAVPSGIYIVYSVWFANQAIGNLAAEFNIGAISHLTPDDDNIAAFRPNAGNSTSGNVRVDSGGVDTDGQIDYPTINGEAHFFAIAVDFDESETRFHVDTDPLSDSPEATIAATPDVARSPGGIIGTGGGDSAEELKVRSIGGVYVP